LRNAQNVRVVNTVITFTTRVAAAPTVASTTPVNGATDVPVADNLAVTFSEPVTGITNATAVLTVDGSTTSLPKALTITANGVTIDPNANLQAGATYRLSLFGTLPGVNAGIRNADGQRLVNTFITFTTVTDTVAPAVTATNPVDGTLNVRGGTATVRFDTTEPVIGVTTGTFVIRPTAGGTPVAATLAQNAAGTRWTLTPTAGLAARTAYTVTVTGGGAAVRDVAGNPLTGNGAPGSTTFTWTFSTR
jgi:methionine-rich copper-binding protein CopC